MAHKILIIDDDPLIIQVLESRLTANGYEVISAADGKEGLNKARSEKPALIILDITLPKMDGFRVTQLIKMDDRYKKIPIILFTGRVIEEDKKIAKEAGADAYYSKDFEPESFLKEIADLISKNNPA